MIKFSERVRKGVSALPIALLISSVVVEVGLAALVTTKLFNSSVLSEQLGAEALTAAETGVYDAVLRVSRYVNCPSSQGGYCPNTYSVTVGSRSACVNIGAITDGQMTIYSKGSAFTREKVVEAVLSISSVDGKVEVQSLKEVEVPESFTDCS